MFIHHASLTLEIKIKISLIWILKFEQLLPIKKKTPQKKLGTLVHFFYFKIKFSNFLELINIMDEYDYIII